MAILGFPERQKALHRVLTLDLTDPRLRTTIPGVRFRPLLYAFTFNGCELRYQMLSDTEVQIVELTPQQSSDDWPYPDYPAFFESIPFDFSEPKPLSIKQVNDLTWQGIDDATNETLIVVVPPSDSYGVSLWGDGDAEEVQVVFQIQGSSGTVSVSNQCG